MDFQKNVYSILLQKSIFQNYLDIKVHSHDLDPRVY
jgi:hypothetical protein